MSYSHQAGILSAGTGLPCRANCGLRFQPVSAPAFLLPKTRGLFDLDALRDAAARRNRHEEEVHHYTHGRRATPIADDFKEPSVMMVGRRVS